MKSLAKKFLLLLLEVKLLLEGTLVRVTLVRLRIGTGTRPPA